MRTRTTYNGVWVTLVATVLSIASFFVPESWLILSLISCIFAIGSGFTSLKIIHKNPRFFKGASILIACIIISSIVLAFNLVLYGLVFTFGE